jgi:polysaccharide biosynthesis protein PslH
MRVLVITETIPAPLDSGGRIRTFNTLRMLAGTHDIHLHAFIRQQSQRAHAAILAPYCRRVTLHHMPRSWPRECVAATRALTTGQPFILARHFSERALASMKIECDADQIDLLYCDHLSMVDYGRQLGRPFLYDAHNLEWKLVDRYASRLPWWSPRRVLARREARLLRGVETSAAGSACTVIALSEEDAQDIAALDPAARIAIVPIALDVAAIGARAATLPAPELLFVGGLHWPPNEQGVLWFLGKVWPMVRESVPAARLTVVGRATRRQRADLERHPGVRAVGAVQDVEPWFASGRALVVPLLAGGGVRVKILDAFARRLPVVSTSMGWEGIAVIPGRHLLSGDEPRDLAAAIVRVLTDDQLARRLADAAHAMVSERHSLESVRPRLLRALDAAVARKAPPGPTDVAVTRVS